MFDRIIYNFVTFSSINHFQTTINSGQQVARLQRIENLTSKSIFLPILRKNGSGARNEKFNELFDNTKICRKLRGCNSDLNTNKTYKHGRDYRWYEPNETKPNQTKLNQTKLNQTKLNAIKWDEQQWNTVRYCTDI